MAASTAMSARTPALALGHAQKDNDPTAALASPTSPSSYLAALVVGLLTGLTAYLALSSLSSRGIWLDEAYTRVVAAAPSDRLFEDIAHNGGNMSLYLVFMRAWLLGGASDWWLRLPSVLFAVACVPAFYLLARRFVSTRAAIAGTGLVGLSPPLIRHAQEARSYSLAVLLVILSWLAIVRLSETQSKSARRWYVALAVAVVYSHLMGLLFVVAQLVWLGSVRRRDAVVAGAWIGVLVIPQVMLAVAPRAQEPSWIPPISGQRLIDSLRYLSGAGTAGAAAVVGVIWLSSAWIAVRRRDDDIQLVPVAWLLLPICGLLALSIGSPMLLPRYVLMAVPAAVLLVCIAWDAFPRVGLVLVLVVAITNVTGLESTLPLTGPDWHAATVLLLDEAEADEAVLFVNSRQLIEHYWDQEGRPRPVPISLTGPAAWGSLPRVDELDVRSAVAALDGVSGAWVVERYRTVGDEHRQVISEIQRRWAETSSWSLYGGAITITRYGSD